MSFEELLQLVDALSIEKRYQLQNHLMETLKDEPTPTLTDAEVWINAFNQAMNTLREGLSEEDLDAMVAAMNEEYIEPIEHEA